MIKVNQISLLLLVFFICSQLSHANHCFTCRSRGKFGDCKDPFPFNSTHLTKGVDKVPCASGWCSKKIEGDEYGEDHDLATERGCLQRPPPDNNPRCSEALYKHKKIFLCLCKGELCNGSSKNTASLLLLLPIVTYTFNYLLL